ncbi:pentatricopeptide repeat protein-like protein [Ophiobolus disseminans]|uniref:Pentatricopeptide repeat protein-like protein n=1 Tax=Ophiobolus disseminans TaxID=1469910 RepID=A0A6A6ZD84_9PLEO|nr:pentatricopeptide repeat protein-like protein [Ophiobolus disseminans]
MLNCRACLWRCIQALDAPTANAHRLRRDVNPIFLPSQQRLLSTTRDVVRKIEARPANLAEVERLQRRGEEPWQRSAVAANQKKQERAALRAPPYSQAVHETPNLENLGRRDPTISERDWQNRKRELRHLQDPLELATFVKKELGKDRATEMLQLVRMASHSMECIVSWNHIIDHYLANERVNDALKVYNEMKKRAQFPDSYTYTILLRGLSINAHHSGVLSKALSVYHSLSAPNSRVEASIIHTNATLKVCARAQDMDALWGVAGKIPENGPQAANMITYITIINAIRQNLLLARPKGETEDEAAARIERGIMVGRQMWEDIVARWRSADLVIDEELVCAMGRLLLIGSRPRDWDDVLSLVEQTMDIPRLVPRLGTAARKEAGSPRVRATNTPPQYRSDDDHLTPDQAAMRGDEFLALTPHGVGRAVSNPLAYARPGNNTLSVVQEACQKIVANKAAREYWELLTDPTTYNIAPDVNNLHMRLRNLRLDRASGAAVTLLQDDMLAKGIVPKPGTFRIAMSTCVRDKNNHNSLRNASQILQVMLKTLEDADAKVVGMFAELAMTFPLARGTDLVDALTVLTPIVRSIRLQLGVGGERNFKYEVGATYLRGDERQDAIGALRKVYSVYDRLLFSNMLPEEQKPPFQAERARLSAFIQRVVFKDQGRRYRDHQDRVKAQARGEEETNDDVDLHSYLKDGGGDEGMVDGRHEGVRQGERRDRRASWTVHRTKPGGKKNWGQNLDARGLA